MSPLPVTKGQGILWGLTAMADDSVLQKANMAVVRRLLEEGFGQGLVRWLPNQIAENYVGHLAIGDHYGPEGVRIDIDGYRAMLADLSVTVDDLFAHDDQVVRRYRLRGTARRLAPRDTIERAPVVLHGIAIDRFEGGWLVESWVQVDWLPQGR